MSFRSSNLRSSRRRGFTLVEVLFALGILALATVVLGTAYVNVMVSYGHLSRDTQIDEDLRFAVSQLLAETKLEKVEEGADFEGLNQRRVRWKAEVQPTTVADLFDVVLTCEADDPQKGGTVTRTQKLRLLRPTWSEATERQKLRDEARKRIEELNGGSQ